MSEDKELLKELKKIDVAYVKLVAPTNDEVFIKETLKKCSSWIYVVSYAGLTGSKQVNLGNVKKISKLIRKNSKIIPRCGCFFHPDRHPVIYQLEIGKVVEKADVGAYLHNLYLHSVNYSV